VIDLHEAVTTKRTRKSSPALVQRELILAL